MERTGLSSFCMLGLITIWLWVTISICKPSSQPKSYYTPDYVESYTVGSFDQLQICKIYCLGLEDSPSRIPTEDFEECGHWFSLVELTQERCGMENIYTAVFRETDSPS